VTADDEQAKYDLVMPFVTVTSNGGPHDDESYVAGWAMGKLAADLEPADNVGKPRAVIFMYHDVIRTDCVAQADRIAMKHGYVASFTDLDDGWTDMQLSKAAKDTFAEGGIVPAPKPSVKKRWWWK
jgi:hypothetical protein